MFDLFVGHESIHNIFKWNRINGDGTEQNEWNGMNEIKYTRLDYNVTVHWKKKDQFCFMKYYFPVYGWYTVVYPSIVNEHSGCSQVLLKIKLVWSKEANKLKTWHLFQSYQVVYILHCMDESFPY